MRRAGRRHERETAWRTGRARARAVAKELAAPGCRSTGKHTGLAVLGGGGGAPAGRGTTDSLPSQADAPGPAARVHSGGSTSPRCLARRRTRRHAARWSSLQCAIEYSSLFVGKVAHSALARPSTVGEGVFWQKDGVAPAHLPCLPGHSTANHRPHLRAGLLVSGSWAKRTPQATDGRRRNSSSDGDGGRGRGRGCRAHSDRISSRVFISGESPPWTVQIFSSTVAASGR